ncbi:Arc family DNA-binding protein [Bradyrhizobium sp. 4]|uniref:Arc family DNA-binding protein n=1 Tax=unclassified Bradyrhizobium TaxID=2631580 RepID=UPI001FF89206|nr:MULTISPECIES: Arc family DNA-binding protein [unclassified Bradyrhizobium]MCK1400122.1 Arc family DNA-binding protein [Bradyrhizobium sp. 39]MCK1750412.1 Arc family DNA-binding protein [Bradyrhizobium sp. 135]UPJ32021.1 Arc family DNA-binding protein [Bradyrhizobium sp. 4]
MPRKPAEYVQFKLRIREGLRRRIERDAEKNNRSANNEAVARLESSYSKHEQQALIETLVGGEFNADFLRLVALKMQLLQAGNPAWKSDKTARSKFVKDLANALLAADEALLSAPSDPDAAVDWLSSDEWGKK